MTAHILVLRRRGDDIAGLPVFTCRTCELLVSEPYGDLVVLRGCRTAGGTLFTFAARLPAPGTKVPPAEADVILLDRQSGRLTFLRGAD